MIKQMRGSGSSMWELIRAGGWLMAPIVVCSILMLIVIIERALKLKTSAVAPAHLREQLLARLIEQGDISREDLTNVQANSPLGDILATGLLHRRYGIESMTLYMQNRASVQIHALEKHINLLGTIGAIAPLLGLLGTVVGIISSFLALTEGATQDPTMLAAGISQALITTAGGMVVAIPAVIAYRYFQRRVVDISVRFEQEAGLLLQELAEHGLLNATAHATPTAEGA